TSTDHAHPSLLSSTHSVTCGAAPLGPSLLSRFLDKFGPDLCFQEGYGMTEASPLTHLSPPHRCVIGSCGTAVPNTLTKLVDLLTGETLDPKGKEGELCVKGPQVMKGYYRNEAATRDMLCPEGWLRTGDIARVDEEGNVFIVDRLKELIKVKGLQV
ncbi:UNVERIFIED_CONTAM: hypothetical protein GTU68_020864, partial [Idotea baltica]|nr:hypothetical protein [Idotea baltica]